MREGASPGPVLGGPSLGKTEGDQDSRQGLAILVAVNLPGVKTIRNTTLACYHYVGLSVSHLGHSREAARQGQTRLR